MVTLLRSTVMMSTMLVTVDERLMAIVFVFLALTGLDHRLDVNKVQVNAAAVKKNLALFLSFFWVGEEGFWLDGVTHNLLR